MKWEAWAFGAMLVGSVAFATWSQTEHARKILDRVDGASDTTVYADTVPPRPEPPESYPTLLVCLEMMECEPVIEAVAGKRCGRVSHPWSESPDTVYLECVEVTETVAVEDLE